MRPPFAIAAALLFAATIPDRPASARGPTARPSEPRATAETKTRYDFDDEPSRAICPVPTLRSSTAA